MDELQRYLLDVRGNMSDRRLPTVNEVREAGDFESKLRELNRSIKRIRGRWQVWNKD
jgi:hypothetical protein